MPAALRSRRASRFIDVGVLDPALFHATYAGIAAAAAEDAQPVVMWGRAQPHVSLGQSQDRRAELVSRLDVPVVLRPLGGGAVWIDESQYCFVLIAPRSLAPARPSEWFAWGLAPAIATCRHFGLAVERREQDLWLGGRKIAGCGAATIGRCAVIASSFLLHFPADSFARCIAGPLSVRGRAARAFRQGLTAALGLTMTDWASNRALPAEGELRSAFRGAVERDPGWQLVDSELSAAETRAREHALAELAEPDTDTRRRLVGDGIKLNAATAFTETRVRGRIVRKVIVGGACTP